MSSPGGAGTVLVVGAGLAGLRTAEALRAAGHGGPIVLLGQERHPPYDRPPLSKQVLSGAWSPDRTSLADGERLAELSLDLRLGRRATGLRRAGDGWVVTTDGGEVPAEHVVLATGSTARLLPGCPPSRRVHVLRTLDDALRLRAGLAAARHLLVVGAGLVGAEVAAVARAADRRVTVLEAAPAPLVRVLGADLGRVLGGLLVEAGVQLRLGVTLAGLVDAGNRVEARLGDGAQLDADLALVSIGSTPAAGWIGDGVPLLPDGAVGCDERGAVVDAAGTPLPGLWAVGDVSAWRDPATGAQVRVEHWTRAGEQAAAVAAAVLGLPAPPTGVPYVWSEQGDAMVQVLGEPAVADRIVQLRGEPGHARGALYAGLRDGALVGVVGVDQRGLLRLRRAVATRVGEDELRAAVARLP